MEEGRLALQGEAYGHIQFATRRLLARSCRRPARPPVLHFDPQRGSRFRVERHHWHQSGRHIRIAEGRPRTLDQARSHRRRTEHRLRRGCLCPYARPKHNVSDTMHQQSRLSTVCTDCHLSTCGRCMGQGERTETYWRHAVELCPPCHFARRTMAVLRQRHARRNGWYGHLARAVDIERTGWRGKSWRTHQHSGQRDVSDVPP